MAMLAEPRRRQKYSVDPRNLAWKNDNNKVGQKLMEKMGWEKGKGLGANEDGNTENIQVSLKSDARGVGCNKSHADNWIAHQDDFNSLLANLKEDHGTNSADNSGEDKAQVSSLEEKSKSSRSRVHYKKFTKGKDLSAAKSVDLDCIFGKRKSKSETSTPVVQSETSSENDESQSDKEENSHGITTITKSVSVQDYFAQKMAQIKAAREAGLVGQQSNNTSPCSSQSQQGTCNQNEGSSDAVQDNNQSNSDQECADTPSESVKKHKKHKKSKKRKYEESNEEDIESSDTQEKEERKKLKNQTETDFTECNTTDVEEPIMSKKSKKMKKNKDDIHIENVSLENMDNSLLIKKSKKCKKSKHSDSLDVSKHDDNTPLDDNELEIICKKSKKKKKNKSKTEFSSTEISESNQKDDNSVNDSQSDIKPKKSKKKKKEKKKKNTQAHGFAGANLTNVKGYGAGRINGYENYKPFVSKKDQLQ